MTTTPASVHEESIIVDGLFCHMDDPIPPTPEAPGLMLEHILASGVTAFNNTVLADPYPLSMEDALVILHDQALMADSMSDQMLQVRTVEDIYTAKSSGRVGVIVGMQGLAPVGADARNVWVLHSLGVRIMQLTYNEHNALGSGCMEPNDQGLTRAGQQVIDAMRRVGVVLDLSHVGLRTSMDALAYAQQPVIFSHVGVQALCDHPRNINDDQIKASAESGGLIGLCPHSIFVEKERGKRPTINDYIDHIEYIAELVGIDHVGIGTDNFSYDTFYTQLGRRSFEGVFPTFFGGYGPEEKHAEGFSKWSEWPSLTEALLARGFSVEDTQKILGQNFMRVFENVWK